MNKKIYSLLLFFPILLLLFSIDANSQPPGSTPITVGAYSSGLGSATQCYGGYWFYAPTSFLIVAVQVPSGSYNGARSTQIYQFQTNSPPSNGQAVYDSVYYPTTNPRMNPRWRIENYGSTGYEISNISSGHNFAGNVVSSIAVNAGEYWAIYSQSQYPSSGYYYSYWSWCMTSSTIYWTTSINGYATYLYPSRGYYSYGYMSAPTWHTYGYCYNGSGYYTGRTIFWYILPCFIYNDGGTGGGTVTPAGTYGPFNPGTDINRNYTCTPNAGKWVSDVKINGVSIGQGAINRASHVYHFGVVNTNQRIAAVFGNRVTVNAPGNYASPAGTSYFPTGANPSFTITPFEGATITNITATPAVGSPVNIPVQNSGMGQTIALGQPGYPFANLNVDWTLDVSSVMNLFTSAGPHGTVTPLGSIDIPWGTQYPVVITPDVNYKVKSLLIDGYDVMDPTLPGYPSSRLDFSAWPIVTYTMDMSYSHTLEATFFAWTITPEVVGIGGTIEPDAPVQVNEHAQYPFIITPDLDYNVSYIGVTNLQTAETTVFDNLPEHGAFTVLFKDVMNDYKLTAQFEIDRYNVVVKNARVMEGGKIFPTGTLSSDSDDGLIVVNSGSSLNFSITSDMGWEISDVLLDGQSQGALTNLPLPTIRADHEVEAQFQRIGFTITATAGNHGTMILEGWELPVPSDGEYMVYYGENARFGIAPDHGYKLGELRIDGAVMNPELEHTFYYVTDDHTITASFVPTNRYTITATAGTGGTISPSGAVSVVEGDDQMFTFTPNNGYEIADVIIDGESQGKISEYEFTDVTADHTIEIVFIPGIAYEMQCSLDATQVVSGQPFDITITTVDQSTQQPLNPLAPVNVTVSVNGGQGTLSGTLQGTIPTSDNKVTISGIIYTNPSGEANVQLLATATGMPDCMLTTNFLAAEPTVQDGEIMFDNVQSYFGKDGSTALSQIDISWTPGDGNNRLVVMRAIDAISDPELPIDGTGYSANTVFESGDAIGGAYVIFNGAGNSLTVTNLIENTLYWVRVFGFNGDAALANYNRNTSNGNPNSVEIVGVDETYTASGFDVTNISPNPAYLDIKFNLNVSTSAAFTIEVVDLQGRVVASFCNKKFYDNGNYQVAIPISKLSSGSYILKIYNGTDFAYQVFTIVR